MTQIRLKHRVKQQTNEYRGGRWYAQGESNPCFRRERANPQLLGAHPTLISLAFLAMSYGKSRQIQPFTDQ